MRYFDLHTDSLLLAEDTALGELNLHHPELSVTPDKLASFESAALIFSVWSGNHFKDEEATDDAMNRLSHARLALDKGGYCVSPSTREEACRGLNQRKPLAFLGVEGGFALNRNPQVVSAMRKLGVIRYTLTHFDSPGWIGADSQGEQHRLNELGREIIQAMNDCKMIPDVSHANEVSMIDVIEVSQGPVLYSHGGPYELSKSNRGITHRAMRGIAESGGLVGLSLFPHHHTSAIRYAPKALEHFFSEYAELKNIETSPITARSLETNLLLKRYPKPVARPSIEYFVNSYRNVVDAVGEDCVSLGSDFDGSPFYFSEIGGCEDLFNLAELLISQGIHSDAVEKLFWKNAQRIIWEVLS